MKVGGGTLAGLMMALAATGCAATQPVASEKAQKMAARKADVDLGESELESPVQGSEKEAQH